ncbi:hypothetical protein GQX74_009516 [Glossina fuscipes]|nr:hypothetical protein GQX74_009516 [Glossina fuscipes]
MCELLLVENNLHEVETADTETENFLVVTVPPKFRKNVWVKRGDFILVELIEEGDKVKTEICKILTAEHINTSKLVFGRNALRGTITFRTDVAQSTKLGSKVWCRPMGVWKAIYQNE